jgi:DNA-binding SARP family transcriptional activator/ABC-type branched-subunit amino acid transport system substrate-binding protein/streptogramin lyase
LLEIRILGPLEVNRDGKPVDLGGAKQRALLTILLLHRLEAVSTDRLIDELWGERSPATAAKTLQAYISRLRKAIGPDLLLTRGQGYLLVAAPEQVDLDRFEALAADGREALAEGDARRAAERSREALALWRGPPLADFAYEPFAQEEIGRLEDAKLDAVEDRVDADLALGNHTPLVGELETLVAENPLRERLLGQLMLALYRAGRQAEALEVYRRGRQALSDELGLEPGPALRELEQAILTHDRALGAPSGPLLARARRVRRGGVLIAAGGIVLLGAAIAAVVISFAGGGKGGIDLAPPNSLARIDPRSQDVLATAPIAGDPSRLAVSGKRVWVSSDDARTVSSVAPAAGAVSAVIRTNLFPSDLAAGSGDLWVVNRQRGKLLKLSPGYRRIVGSHRIPGAITLASADDRNLADPWSVATGGGSVWVTDGSRLLRRADPATGRVDRVYRLPDRVNGVAVGAGAVWAISGPSASVLRINPRGGDVKRIPVVAGPGPSSPYPIAVDVGLGSVWVLNGNTASVTRIDPAQRGVGATIPIGVARDPRRLAVGAGAAWVADGDGTLARIDPATNSLTTTAVAPSLSDVGIGAGSVWASVGGGLAGGSVPTVTPAGGKAEPLPQARCSPVVSAPGARPRYLIASDLPLQGDDHDAGAQMTEAIELALQARGFQAGPYAIGFQACDDSVLAHPLFQVNRCASNMRAYAADRSVIGVVGPYNSGCAVPQIPIANRAPDGPLAMVSPSNTDPGLTHRAPGRPGDPERYYPTGIRNYARVIASDEVQGYADALLARRLGLRRVFVIDDVEPYGNLLVSSFARAARRIGLTIAGKADWRGVGEVSAAVRRAVRSHPDGIFVASYLARRGVARIIRRLRSSAPSAQLLGPDAFAIPQVDAVVGPAVEGMHVTQLGIVPSLLRGPGKRFVAELRKHVGGQVYAYSAQAAQAADVLLDAIARSNGSRRSVTRALFETRIEDGILGSFHITPTGDTSAKAITALRIEHGRGVPKQVITPPRRLLAGG